MTAEQEEFLKRLFSLCEEYEVVIMCEGVKDPGRYSIVVEILLGKKREKQSV